MSTKNRLVFLLFAAALLTVGCDRGTSSGPAKPSGPSIKELPEEAKLLKELIDSDACVCAFSGTCLEVWLECEIKEGGADDSKTYPSWPVAITRHACQGPRAPEDIHGKIIVWGDIMQSPAIRILVTNLSDDGVGASSFGRTLPVPPLPKESGIRGSSGLGFHWECPSELPGEGKEFTIASFQQTFYQHRGELPKTEVAVLRESTLRLKARCLPLVAPDPAPEEEQAVAALREVGASVFLEGCKGEYYEGRPKGSVKRITFTGERAFFERPQVTDADLVYLKQLPKLESLSLVGTQVGDDGLVHLTGLVNLKLLNLGGPDVTDEGVAKLQEALPNCEILVQRTESE